MVVATLAAASACALAAGLTGAAPALAAAGDPWVRDTPAPGTANYQNELVAVTAPAPGQAFAAGYTINELPGATEVRTLVQRWDGTAWTVMNTPDVETAPAHSRLLGIHGSSADDVWAVGSAQTVPEDSTSRAFAIHYDGTSWTQVPLPIVGRPGSTYLSDVVSLGPTDAWAVGSAGEFYGDAVVYHWDGTAWTGRTIRRPAGCLGQANAGLTTVAAAGPRQVYAGGYCRTAEGDIGYVLQRQGGLWKEVARTTPGIEGFSDLTITRSGDLWAVGALRTPGVVRGIALTRIAGVWKQLQQPDVGGANAGKALYGVAEGPDGVVVVGNVDDRSKDPIVSPQVFTRTATGWVRSRVRPAPTQNAYLWAVASDGTNVWAVGSTSSRVRFATIPLIVRN